MYKSPIEIFHKDYMQQYVEQMDNSIFMAIERKFGADIDRGELIKALNYDRGQYEKGFADGVASAQPKWIPVPERLPDEGGSYLVCQDFSMWGVEHKAIGIEQFVKQFGGWYCDGVKIKNITHWMPLPEPPKGDE